MGAFSVMARRMPELVPEGVDFSYIGRPAALEPVRGLPGRPPLRAGADRADRAFVGRRTVVWRSAQQLRLLRRELLLREHAAVA